MAIITEKAVLNWHSSEPMLIQADNALEFMSAGRYAYKLRRKLLDLKLRRLTVKTCRNDKTITLVIRPF